MYYQKYLYLIIGLFIAGSLSIAGELSSPQNSSDGASDPPWVIHYGLNDSHGRSWVRENSNGVIGIVYFERVEGGGTEGTLKYKTILPDGSKITETVCGGQRLEKSVLLYDASAEPHIFVARSNDLDQVIDHYFKDNDNQWQNETIIHFNNEGGKFIYELSADKGPDHSFHLLILKTRSDVDSEDFMDAWIDSYLYHMTNATGTWEKELVYNYDMPYTADMYVKSSIRQDMEIDDDGYVHVAFGRQVNDTYDPSILHYATNKSGQWVEEAAWSNYDGLVDDAGWFPSLCLDNDGVPHISCQYIHRYITHSAMSARLQLLKRVSAGNWEAEVVAQSDDGYYGYDGRVFTGALSHLVFDGNNTPHIIFSDVASTHYDYQRWNVGNIRYAVRENDTWNITTIYRQPLPTDFWHAIEMLWMCLVVPETADTFRVIGQEIEVTGEGVYSTRFVECAWGDGTTDIESNPESSLPETPHLFQNYPNPFNPGTFIGFDLPRQSQVTVTVYNVVGQQVKIIVDDEFPAGSHSVYWDGTGHRGQRLPTGFYFARLKAGDYVESAKMLLLK